MEGMDILKSLCGWWRGRGNSVGPFASLLTAEGAWTSLAVLELSELNPTPADAAQSAQCLVVPAPKGKTSIPVPCQGSCRVFAACVSSETHCTATGIRVAGPGCFTCGIGKVAGAGGRWGGWNWWRNSKGSVTAIRHPTGTQPRVGSSGKQ